jgi:septal ring factor EnvC (AmiA/AmiB activator)
MSTEQLIEGLRGDLMNLYRDHTAKHEASIKETQRKLELREHELDQKERENAQLMAYRFVFREHLNSLKKCLETISHSLRKCKDLEDQSDAIEKENAQLKAQMDEMKKKHQLSQDDLRSMVAFLKSQ